MVCTLQYTMTMCLAAAVFAVQAQTYQVDDSYTPSQRFARYSTVHPELSRPSLEFVAGQQVVFDRTYKKIGDRELHLDLFLPPPKVRNEQTIVFIHGGGWRSGNKSHFYPLANLLAQRGYTVVTPEYRLSIEAPYPAALTDVNDAIVWLKLNHDEFAINPQRIALGGGSSGGQMAGLLANTANQTWFKSRPENDDTTVNAAIVLDGVLDFTHPLAIENENKRLEKSAAGLWFGGSMENAPAKWRQASTAKHIHAASPPMLIISSGQMRFTAGKDTVIDKLKSHSIAAKYYQHDNVVHPFWLFEPYVSQTAERIDAFLSHHALVGDD